MIGTRSPKRFGKKSASGHPPSTDGSTSDGTPIATMPLSSRALLGRAELRCFDHAACAAIAQESRLTEKELEDYMVSLDRDTGPTAYLFRCGSCGSWGGYSDTH